MRPRLRSRKTNGSDASGSGGEAGGDTQCVFELARWDAVLLRHDLQRLARSERSDHASGVSPSRWA